MVRGRRFAQRRLTRRWRLARRRPTSRKARAFAPINSAAKTTAVGAAEDRATQDGATEDGAAEDRAAEDGAAKDGAT